MSAVVVGANHRTAPLAVLERLAIAPDDVAKAVADLAGRDTIREAVVLSTCGRTEIYVVAERFHGAHAAVTLVGGAAAAGDRAVVVVRVAEADAVAEKQEEEAFRYVRRLRHFYLHLFQYVIVILALTAVNLITWPRYLWVLWVAGGWGRAGG